MLGFSDSNRPGNSFANSNPTPFGALRVPAKHSGKIPQNGSASVPLQYPRDHLSSPICSSTNGLDANSRNTFGAHCNARPCRKCGAQAIGSSGRSCALVLTIDAVQRKNPISSPRDGERRGQKCILHGRSTPV